MLLQLLLFLQKKSGFSDFIYFFLTEVFIAVMSLDIGVILQLPIFFAVIMQLFILVWWCLFPHI